MLIFIKLLAQVPLLLLHMCGAVLGWLVYLASPRYRTRFRENLGRFESKTGKHVSRIATIAAVGKGVMELPAVWFRGHHAVAALAVKTTGQATVDAARVSGKGILFLTPHLGCFEITAQFLAAQAPITVLYRRPKKHWVETIVIKGRRRDQIDLATTDIAGVRKLMKALARKEAVGMLPDQAPSAGEGVWAEFFGYPVYTMTLAQRLAEKSGATVILTYASADAPPPEALERIAAQAGLEPRYRRLLSDSE